MDELDLGILLKKLQYKALVVLREIKDLRLKLPVISLQGIEFKDAREVLSLTTCYRSVTELVQNNIKLELENDEHTLESLMITLKHYYSDFDALAIITDYLKIINAIINNEYDQDKSILSNLAKFCHNVIVLLSSIYGYELSENTYLMTPLVKLSGVHSITSFELERPSSVLFISLFPYSLYGTLDLYILSLHEFGHLFRVYYLRRKKKWSTILNTIIKILTKSGKRNLVAQYKNWLEELFADYFAFMVLGRSYVDTLWSHYGYFIPDKNYAKSAEMEYPPLTLRFKLISIAFDKLKLKKIPSYLIYVNKLIRDNSNGLLAGYFEFNELDKMLNMLNNLFFEVIVENPYWKPPYFIINENKEEFSYLYSLIHLKN